MPDSVLEYDSVIASAKLDAIIARVTAYYQQKLPEQLGMIWVNTVWRDGNFYRQVRCQSSLMFMDIRRAMRKELAHV